MIRQPSSTAVPHSPGPVRWIQERVHGAHVRRQKEKGTSRFSYLPQIQFFDLPRLRRLLAAIEAEPLRWQGIGVVTGGPIGFLENHAWYYRANLRFGARFPRLTKQLVVVARTADSPTGERGPHVPQHSNALPPRSAMHGG